jgi:hypothetical protein
MHKKRRVGAEGMVGWSRDGQTIGGEGDIGRGVLCAAAEAQCVKGMQHTSMIKAV